MLNLAGHHQIMSLGELLTGLPSEVRVHIFCLALLLPTSGGAWVGHWLNLAMVGQDLLESLQAIV